MGKGKKVKFTLAQTLQPQTGNGGIILLLL